MAMNLGMLSGDPRQALQQNMQTPQTQGERLGMMFGNAMKGTLGRDTRSPQQMLAGQFQQALQGLDPNDPNYKQKVMALIAKVDPLKAIEYQQQIERLNAGSYSSSGKEEFKDADGNVYFGTRTFDNKTGQTGFTLVNAMTGQVTDPKTINGLQRAPQGMTMDDTITAAVNKLRAESNAQANIDLLENLATKVESMDAETQTYSGIMAALKDGANTGALMEYLPTFRASTAKFEQMAAQLSLNQLSKNTFGSLSEKELDFVRIAALPKLNNQEMQKFIMMRQEADLKYRSEIIHAINWLKANPEKTKADLLLHMEERSKKAQKQGYDQYYTRQQLEAAMKASGDDEATVRARLAINGIGIKD